MAELKSYHFSLGNSTHGPIGFCARIEATSKRRAVKRLRQLLFENGDKCHLFSDSKEYVSFYFNRWAITADDIDEVDLLEESESEVQHG